MPKRPRQTNPSPERIRHVRLLGNHHSPPPTHHPPRTKNAKSAGAKRTRAAPRKPASDQRHPSSPPLPRYRNRLEIYAGRAFDFAQLGRKYRKTPPPAADDY
jgi:hypothetical protein